MKTGGLAQNRTGMQGFAILCVTTPPRGLTGRAYRGRLLMKQQCKASILVVGHGELPLFKNIVIIAQRRRSCDID
jgi:hypothetical protein